LAQDNGPYLHKLISANPSSFTSTLNGQVDFLGQTPSLPHESLNHPTFEAKPCSATKSLFPLIPVLCKRAEMSCNLPLRRFGMKNPLVWFLGTVLVLVLALPFGIDALAQDITGGGVLRDITGGAALIFRAPQNPTVHMGGGQGTTGGGKVRTNRGAKPPVRQQDNIIARANAARSASKTQEAEEQYQLAARIAPDDARAFAGLGNVYVDQGRFAEAVKAYQQAIKVKPDYSAAYLPLAFSLARLNRYPESIDVYQQTLKFDQTSPEVFNNLSFAYNHTNRYQEAVDSSLQAIKLLGETGEAFKLGFQERNEIRSYAYKNLGNAYNGMKRYDDAANALKKSAEIEPKNASAHFNLGLTLYNAGRYSEAIESYKECIKLRPTLGQAYFNLGLTYYAVSDKRAAMDQYEALKSIDAEMAKQLYDAIKQ
jgi:tetratricopeptide (TPR) repeat protein